MGALNGLMLLTMAFGGAEAAAGSEGLRADSVVITLVEEAEVPAREAGMLAEISVREGDLVEEGDLLARIDDEHVRLEMERAAAQLTLAKDRSENDVEVRLAEATSEQADEELERANETLKRYPKSISATELGRLRLAARKATLEIEAAKRTLRESRSQLRVAESEYGLSAHDVERRKIQAPISGIVVEVYKRRGEWVQPGEAVARIVRIDRLRAEGFLHARDLVEDPAGRPVKVQAVLPGEREGEFAGTLVFVSPEVNPVNGQVRVWAEVNNPDLRLRPGLPATMTIEMVAGEKSGE